MNIDEAYEACIGRYGWVFGILEIVDRLPINSVRRVDVFNEIPHVSPSHAEAEQVIDHDVAPQGRVGRMRYGETLSFVSDGIIANGNSDRVFHVNPGVL